LGIFDLEGGQISSRHVVHDAAGKIIGEWGRRKLLQVEIEKPTKRRNVHISRQGLRAELLAGLHDERRIAWGHCLKELTYNSQ
jgi:salicylate hydroxylase